jgi:geranylgeranyl pyrophosphate synthase
VRWLVAADGAAASPFRLLAPAVLGALTGSVEPAMPVCAVSRLWWIGAQLLDDLADGTPDRAGAGLSAGEAVLVGMACGTLLPLAIVDRQPLPEDVRRDWRASLIATSLHATAGQLDDLAGAREEPGWATVMARYRGKTGAPYGRDATMAARLSTSDDSVLRAWRVFGELFGVLRQLANDNQPDSIAEDLANGTGTLLFVHALEVSAPSRRIRLVELREAARRGDGDALLDALQDPAIRDGYAERVTAIRRRGCALLDQLAPESPYRALLHTLLHASAGAATAPR